MHPSDDILGQESRLLAGKRIVLGLCGSVAVMRTVDLARLLMRHGARVYPVMSRSARRLIGEDLVHWATGQRPVTRLSGAIEHVALAGNVPEPVDLVLVAPATANTIGKIAAGIDDTPVTTVVTTAWGQGLPIVVVPAMHLSMYDHPLVLENLEKLKRLGLHVIQPLLAEGKAKFPDLDRVFLEVARLLCARPAWKGRRVLITAGRTEEPLDPVRVVTNPASGRMGLALARQAYVRGAAVDLLLGVSAEPPPHGVERLVRARTAQDFLRAADGLLDPAPDVVIAAAAVGDWRPRHVEPEKVPTRGQSHWTVELVPTPKVVDHIRATSPRSLMVQFRALAGVGLEAAREDAVGRIRAGQADLVAFNDVAQPGHGFGVPTNRVHLFDVTGEVLDTGLASKDDVASKILDEIEKKL